MLGNETSIRTQACFRFMSYEHIIISIYSEAIYIPERCLFRRPTTQLLHEPSSGASLVILKGHCLNTKECVAATL